MTGPGFRGWIRAGRTRTHTSLRSFATLSLAVATSAGCGGDAFTTGDAGPTPNDAGAVTDAVSTGGDAAADAGPAFCETHTGHTLCEDFTAGVPDQLAGGITGGATLEADIGDYRSPPQSMLTIVPAALTAKGDSAGAIGTKDFSTVTGTQFELAVDLKIDPTCTAGNGGDLFSFVALSFPETRYELAFGVTQNGVELVEVPAGADASSSSGGVQVHTPQTPVQPSGWQTWSVTVSGVGKTVSLSIDGQVVFSDEKLTTPPVAILEHPTLAVGTSVKTTTGHSETCRAHTDNLLFDVRAVALPQ